MYYNLYLVPKRAIGIAICKFTNSTVFGRFKGPYNFIVI